MATKILYFKFTKKNTESHERNSKSKNYANIFNNILNGEKIDKQNENTNNNLENKTIPLKKNKIKCISKVNNINNQEGIKPSEMKSVDDIKNKKETSKKKQNINFSKKIKKSLKTETNLEKTNTNPIDEYLDKSKVETKNIKIDLNQVNVDKNRASFTHTSKLDNKNNINKFSSKEKKPKKNYIKKQSTMKFKKKSNSKLKTIRKSKEFKDLNISLNQIENNKNNNKSKIVNNIKKYQLSHHNNSPLKVNKTNLKNKKRISLKSNDIKYNKVENNKKRFTSLEKKNLIFNKKTKKNNLNYFNKITITNDNISEDLGLKNKKKSFNYTLNQDSKSKKLILNNTNSNINININITNINDKNINKKENSFYKKNKKSKNKTDNNNFNNNITTVNIINNNSNNKKKLNDYRLLFYNNHPKKEKYSTYLNKISSKGIEIQSININLGDEENNTEDFNKAKLKHNLTSNNNQNNNSDFNNINFKKKEPENEKKEVQSEYEHFRDLEDFWSSKSLTSYSCKSGYTASRKLRSLSRERDKIKFLNQCKNQKDRYMERISDKLLNIVNDFHNNSINDLKEDRKSIGGIKTKFGGDKISNKKLLTKGKKPRKKKYY